MKKWLTIVVFVLSLALGVNSVLPCGFDVTFRAYLDRRFWQPFSKFEKSLGRIGFKGRREARDKAAETALLKIPFAGMAENHDNELVQKVRNAYRQGEFVQVQAAVKAALLADITDEDRQEMLLVEAKADMRLGEKGDEPLLREAREKLLAFLQSVAGPAMRSEARGWLARVYYLLGDYVSATKIYLDEMSAADSIFSRDSLVQSLRMLFPYNGSSVRLADHLEEYFDTPAHALFVVNLVTNPIYYDPEERAAMAEVARKTLEVLQRHQNLFSFGTDSESLALALMRTALYMGDPSSALAYAGMVPGKSTTFASPEYNWMKAACYFLQRRYQEAEAPLLKMLSSRRADFRDRNAAAQGLVGVYLKLKRPADQLHAAFQAQAAIEADPAYLYSRGSLYSDPPYFAFPYWPAGGMCLDLPYLLDVQLTDADLLDFLNRHARSAKGLKIKYQKRPRSAYEMAEYALAVRYARQERFEEAAEIYARLQSRPRANRMLRLISLHAAAKDPALPPQESLQAWYAYAAFLEEHSTQIFFNDMLWERTQTWTFLGHGLNAPYTEGGRSMPVENDAQGLLREEREFFLQQEQRVRDEQEERWRAYLILQKIVDQAGPSELGRMAAEKSFRCLVLINKERFGRREEIASGLTRMANWLRAYKKDGNQI